MVHEGSNEYRMRPHKYHYKLQEGYEAYFRGRQPRSVLSLYFEY